MTKDWENILRDMGYLKCSICGYDKNINAIDFHHRIPKDKEMQISHIIRKKPTEHTLLEIRKCIPLCANCHRELHAKDKTLRKNYKEPIVVEDYSDYYNRGEWLTTYAREELLCKNM